MRRRLALLCASAVIALVALPASHMVASAAPSHRMVLAQSGTDSQNSESGDKGGSGQKDPEAETGGSNSSDTEAPEGPPWTYQMARIGIGLVLLIVAGLGLLYYRMILSRQRGSG